MRSQHSINCTVELNPEKQSLTVQQELVYFNQSNDTLQKIILNDWNNAYSEKFSPLGNRFSDEFVRNFHLAKDEERGATTDLTFIDQNKMFLDWSCTSDHSDLIEIVLRNPLLPRQQFSIFITYKIKLPSAKFTGYGYGDKGDFMLKDWLLTPARFQANHFTLYSNVNLDDSANAISDYQINLSLPKNYDLVTDLDQNTSLGSNVILTGKNRSKFSIYLSKKLDFETFENLRSFFGHLTVVKVSNICTQGIVECLNFANQY